MKETKKINFSHCNVNGEIIIIITIIVEMILQRIIFFPSICKRFISKAKCIHKAKSIKFHKRNAFSAIKIEKKITMRKQKSFWFVQRNHLKWNTINVFFMSSSTLICVIASQQHKIDSLDSCWPLHRAYALHLRISTHYVFFKFFQLYSIFIKIQGGVISWINNSVHNFLFIFLRRACFGISNAFSLLRDFRNDWNAIDSN